MRPLLPLLAALALASVTVAAPAAPPSFLVILADDLGYSDPKKILPLKHRKTWS